MSKVMQLGQDHPVYALSKYRAQECYNDESDTLDMLSEREFELKDTLEKRLSQEQKKIYEKYCEVITELSRIKAENAYLCGMKDGFSLKKLIKKR